MKMSLYAKVELVIGLVILAIVVILVFMAAVMRFAGYPIIWSVDFAQLLFIWLSFLGANRALRNKGHLGVDFFVRRFDIKIRLVIESVLSVVILIFLISLAIKGVELTLLNKERVFGDSGIPYAFVTIAVPFGCLLLSATVISNFVQAWRQRSTKDTLILMQHHTSIARKN